MSNWDGIAALPEEERLGAIEGEVRHIIARRMKRIGARWTIPGGDRMARLLAHRANGELACYAGGGRDFAQEVLRRAVGQEVIDPRLRVRGEDPVAWLRAGMPILAGPFASRPFVKYVLRELVSLRPSYAGF